MWFQVLLFWLWLCQARDKNLSSPPHHHSRFPQCQVGYIKGGSYANHSRQILPSCLARGYQDRPSLPHILKQFRAGRSSSSSSLVAFYDSLTTATDITNLIFLGDSVSSQLFHFLFCDFYHTDLFHISGVHWVNQTCQFCLSYVDIWMMASAPSSSTSPSTPKLLRLYNRQFNLPCLHDSHTNPGRCSDPRLREELSATFIQRLVTHVLSHSPPSSLFPSSSSAFSSPSEKTVVILNYGLHVLTSQIADWSLRGMIRGILEMISSSASSSGTSEDALGRRHRNVSFFYRETSSQVFASTRDGSYSSTQGNQSSVRHVHDPSLSFCCQYPRDLSRESNWRNHLIREYLMEYDPHWSKSMGWIPFYNFSLELFDLRAESHKPNIVDCTHFIYLPMAYFALWEEIRFGYLRTREN